MSTHFTEDELVSAVANLTRKRLISFVEAEIIVPVQSDAGHVYRHIDIARIELLCDLSEHFDLQDDALGIVISLVDQLHGVRAELRCVLDAVEQEKSDVRNRIGKMVFQARSKTG